MLIARTPMEARLAELLQPTIEGMGYELVRLRVMGAGGRDAPLTLQVMAEKPDRTMEVDDCAELSNAMSAVLDVEDPIERDYSLEVSSPGIDRPLTRAKDWEEFAGHRAKVEMAEPVDGRRNFRGDVVGLDGEEIVLALDDVGEVRLPLSGVGDAKLVITDALIAESLRKRRVPDPSRADDVEQDDGED